MSARRVTTTPMVVDGPRWQTLLDRFSSIEQRTAQNEGRIAAIETLLHDMTGGFRDITLALTGGLVGGRYQEGLRDVVEQQGRILEQQGREVRAVKVLAEDANTKADSVGRSVGRGVIGVWTLTGSFIIWLITRYQDFVTAFQGVTGGHH